MDILTTCNVDIVDKRNSNNLSTSLFSFGKKYLFSNPRYIPHVKLGSKRIISEKAVIPKLLKGIF